jgi:hypothetical protein
LTNEIIKQIYKREYLHKKALSSKDDTRKNQWWECYRKARNYVTKLIKNTKLNYYKNVTEIHRNNPKKLWASLRNVLPKPSTETINEISADTFNNFFATIGEKTVAKCENDISSNVNIPESIHKFKFDDINEALVMKLLRGLSSNSKNDILGCDSKLLNLGATIIAPSLTLLFNFSLRVGYIPNDWKIARVTPAFKGKGDKNIETNYRPLSVIAHIAKLIEKCVHIQLLKYLYDHSFISKNQFAYLKNHSTQYCLHRVIDDVLENINFKEKTALCFLDIRKCFDTIDHTILLNKLSKYGICKNEYKWFESYLKSRSQIVSHNNSMSGLRNVNIGVPQGTILGPILFLLFVNDLSNSVEKCQINIFADDVVIYCAHESIEQLEYNLQYDMNNVFKWYQNNKLSLSLEKCHTMVINSNLNEKIRGFNITLGNTPLTQVSEMKYLGATIDEQLKWVDHVKSVAKKVNITNARIRKLHGILPLETRLQIHNSLNVPVIDYASTVWGEFSNKVSDFINTIEKRSARAISGIYDIVNTRGSSIMSDLGMRPFRKRNEYYKCLIMYKAIHGLTPDFLLDYITFTYEINQRNLRSSNNLDLHVPKPLSEKFRKSLLYSGPKLWNTLPETIKHAGTVNDFKTRYKKLMKY